ncbi:MAG: hypothetical protein A2148_03355 [Chloroflexi bacterium RBG_16_68_14]|nr:MAG: hypothetical protein A2148_03355 [Chloroflexi bacterium RBG_16_68_14]
MAYEVILFDFGETLARTGFEVWGEASLSSLRRFGFRGSLDNVARAWSKAWEDIDTPEGVAHVEHSTDAEAYDRWRGEIERRALAHLGFQDPSPELIAATLEIQDRHQYVLFDDTLPALAALRQRGYRLGVLSNFTWRLPEIVRELGLAPYVEHVVVSARAGYRKPHPEIFRRALEAFRVEPSEALVVGDSLLADVEGARRAGIAAVLLDRSGAHDGHKPRIRSLAELLDLV